MTNSHYLTLFMIWILIINWILNSLKNNILNSTIELTFNTIFKNRYRFESELCTINIFDSIEIVPPIKMFYIYKKKLNESCKYLFSLNFVKIKLNKEHINSIVWYFNILCNLRSRAVNMGWPILTGLIYTCFDILPIRPG